MQNLFNFFFSTIFIFNISINIFVEKRLQNLSLKRRRFGLAHSPHYSQAPNRRPQSREQREREMSATASYLARRAAQKERVRILYRRALKDTLNWAVHRHLFYQDVFPFFFFSFLPRFSAILIYFSRVLFHFTLFFIFWYSSSSFQASDLREKFDANKHVVRSLIRSVNYFYLFWNFVNDMKSSRNWSWANTLFLKAKWVMMYGDSWFWVVSVKWGFVFLDLYREFEAKWT